MATQAKPKPDSATPQPVKTPAARDWTKPAAIAIPKEGYFEYVEGTSGPVFPRTPACYGFTVIAKMKPGREPAMRAYADKLGKAVQADPAFLASLKLHYLKWVMFDIAGESYFLYEAIFDTDFDKYTDDAVAIFNQSGLNTAFENLEGFPEDWRTNAPAFIKFVRDHHRPSFMEYGEYPYVPADEIKKALRVKKALGEMLDQMQ